MPSTTETFIPRQWSGSWAKFPTIVFDDLEGEQPEVSIGEIDRHGPKLLRDEPLDFLLPLRWSENRTSWNTKMEAYFSENLSLCLFHIRLIFKPPGWGVWLPPPLVDHRPSTEACFPYYPWQIIGGESRFIWGDTPLPQNSGPIWRMFVPPSSLVKYDELSQNPALIFL